MGKGVKASLLATCVNPECKHVFAAYSMYASAGGSIDMPNGSSGSPCPKCRGPYVMPAGKYTATETEVLFAPRTAEAREIAQRAWDVVREALGGLIEPENFKQEVTKRAPELSVLWNLFPTTKQDAYQFWVMVLMVLSILLDGCKDSKPTVDQRVFLPPEVIDAILRVQQPSPDGIRTESQAAPPK